MTHQQVQTGSGGLLVDCLVKSLVPFTLGLGRLRRLYGLSSKEEITEKVILSRFLSLLPADCYSAVVNKHPKTGLEASRLVQEYEETRTYVRKKQPWKQDNYHHYKREQRVASPVSPPARENSVSESGNASGSVGSSPRGNS